MPGSVQTPPLQVRVAFVESWLVIVPPPAKLDDKVPVPPALSNVIVMFAFTQPVAAAGALGILPTVHTLHAEILSHVSLYSPDEHAVHSAAPLR